MATRVVSLEKPHYITTLGFSNVVNAHPKLQTHLAIIQISMYVHMLKNTYILQKMCFLVED